jgi:O-antigen/teichoic acid export membrane protein
MAIFAPLIIRIMYGETYLPSTAPLRVAVWYVAFSYLGVARNAWILCENKQKYLKYMYLSAAVINIVLNAIFIPMWGTSGAAFASLVTQISTCIILPAFISDLRPNVVLMIDGIRMKDTFTRNEIKGLLCGIKSSLLRRDKH